MARSSAAQHGSDSRSPGIFRQQFTIGYLPKFVRT